MDFIVSWLNQIVLIVLFAVVLDLITPSSSMQKYVKLVMGLMIMVTLLKPVAVLFDREFDISRIQWPEKIAEFASFDVIKSQAEEMKQAQAATAEKQVQAHLANTIKQQLESEYPVEVLHVETEIAGSKVQQDAAPKLQAIRIELQTASESPKNRGIASVEPVQIGMGKQVETPSKAGNVEAQTEISSKVQKELADQFKLSGSFISIHWKEG